jgi:hypothetical protein
MPAGQPIPVFTACLARDLHILRYAVEALRRFLTVASITVATSRENFSKFRRVLGPDVKLLDEDTMIPGMKISDLRQTDLPLPGWYFQQLLKFAFVFHVGDAADFLIWDADTILLRPLELFDAAGRAWFTMADEHHEPYFETYERLLGLTAPREFSMIAQHMVVNCAVLREMLGRIEKHCPGEENWAWKIIKHQSPRTTNRFSEYETYGHYVKQVHPEMAAFRQLEWTRDGALTAVRLSERHLRKLGERYAFAAFESRQSLWNRFLGWKKRRLGW